MIEEGYVCQLEIFGGKLRLIIIICPVVLLLSILSLFRKLVDSEPQVNGTTHHANSPVNTAAQKTTSVIKSEEDSGKPKQKDTEADNNKQVGPLSDMP